MTRFSQIVPKTPLEQERFFLDVAKKLGGTEATLEEVDQRSTWPGASVTSEIERLLADLTKRIETPLRAQISELERRIDSLERSARF
jgi:hypothetical protein